MKYANTMADLIGNTPLVKLQKISSEANLFAKCEFMNPISIKDRPVLLRVTLSNGSLSRWNRGALPFKF